MAAGAALAELFDAELARAVVTDNQTLADEWEAEGSRRTNRGTPAR